MAEQYNHVNVNNLYSDGGWVPEQTYQDADATATQAMRAIDPASLSHIANTPRPVDQTQQMQTIEPLIPTRNVHDDSEIHTGDRKAGRVPLALASTGLLGLAALGVVSVLTIENRERSEAHASATETQESMPTPTITESTPAPSPTPSPTTTQVKAVKKTVAPIPSKTSASPARSASPSPTMSSPTPSPSKTVQPSPSETPCQWEMNGATVTVGECGDAIAYDEATGDASFTLTRGMAFDAQCIAGPRIQIVMANSVDYVNPGYFDASNLPPC